MRRRLLLQQAKAYPNLLSWVRADTVQVDGDNKVQILFDLAGKNNWIQTTTSSQWPVYTPNILNSQPVIRFDTSNDTLQVSSKDLRGLKALTVIMAYAPAQASAANTARHGRFLEMFGAAESFAIGGTASALSGETFAIANIFATSDRRLGTAGFTWTAGEAFVESLTMSNIRGTTLRKNGTAITLNLGANCTAASDITPSRASLPTNVVCTMSFRGDLAECMIFGAALSAGELNAYEKAMGARYGITVA